MQHPIKIWTPSIHPRTTCRKIHSSGSTNTRPTFPMSHILLALRSFVLSTAILTKIWFPLLVDTMYISSVATKHSTLSTTVSGASFSGSNGVLSPNPQSLQATLTSLPYNSNSSLMSSIIVAITRFQVALGIQLETFPCALRHSGSLGWLHHVGPPNAQKLQLYHTDMDLFKHSFFYRGRHPIPPLTPPIQLTILSRWTYSSHPRTPPHQICHEH